VSLPEELPKILKIARPGAWIDMESGLRDDDDNFDVTKAQNAIRLTAEISRAEALHG
jgi:hypothetical protein